MLSFYLKKAENESFQSLDHPVPGCWIHVDSAQIDDLRYISALLNIEIQDLQDSMDKYEIPRIEKFNEICVVYARHPISKRESGLFTITFTTILSKDYVITICPIQSSLVETIISSSDKVNIEATAAFMIFLLLKISQCFTYEIKKIRNSVLKQEKEIHFIESEDIEILIINEENLNQYLGSLIPIKKLLETISHGKHLLLTEEDRNLLEDLLNTAIQSEDLCSTNLRTIRSLRDSYQIIFTNQLNKTIRLLTALTILLSIPTMISSLYGMNIKLPNANNPFAFIYIILSIVCIGSGAFYLFQRKKWL
jgi:magnesium transporter